MKKKILCVMMALCVIITTLPQMALGAQAQIPKVCNVRITGNSLVGEKLVGSYEYYGDETVTSATYNWYASASTRPPLTKDTFPIAGQNTKELTLTETQNGSYIVFEVILTDSVGTHTFRSPTMGPVLAQSEIPAPPVANLVKPVLNYDYNTSTPKNIYAHYTYADVNGDAELGSIIQWSSADSLNGKYTDMPGETNLCYIVKDADIINNKFFRFSVIPKNANETGESGVSFGIGVSSLIPTVQNNAITNGSLSTGKHYTTYNLAASYNNYFYKLSDGDYDSSYGYTAAKPTGGITGLDLGKKKKFNTLVIYAGAYGGKELYDSAILHSAADRKDYVEIPLVTGEKLKPENTFMSSFINSKEPIEIRFPEIEDRYIYLENTRGEVIIGEFQAYYLNTPENVFVQTNILDTIKLPVGTELPTITATATNLSDGSSVPENDIYIVPPTIPADATRGIYHYNITVKDKTGGLTLVQRNVELVPANTEVTVELSNVFLNASGDSINNVVKGKNRALVVASNSFAVDKYIQPVAVLYEKLGETSKIKEIKVGNKTLLNATNCEMEFSFDIENEKTEFIKIFNWEDSGVCKPLVNAGFLPSAKSNS